MSEQIKIDRKNLYKIYMKMVDDVAEDLDWKTNFSPKEIVDMLSTILEKNPDLITDQE